MEQNVDSVSVNYILIISLMIGAGFLGGLTNFFRLQEEKNWTAFFKNILMGTSASFLIPLFLNMISSNLLKESSTDNIKVFVFFGFCLIASLSSKAFIQTISDRLLSDLKKTKDEVEDLKHEVGPVISQVTEPENDKGIGISVRAFSFDEDVKKVLGSLNKTKYAWRTLKGIANETKLEQEIIKSKLTWLLENKLAVRQQKNRNLWGLTLKGRGIVENIPSGSSE